MIHYLTLGEFKEICFQLTKELFEFEEPIPNFETRFPQKIESILEMPKQIVFGEELYPDTISKAVCYFFFIIKNHAFLNGNKRIAIVTTYVFLRLNEFRLVIPNEQMYKLAIVTSNFSGDHKTAFNDLVKIFSENVERVN